MKKLLSVSAIAVLLLAAGCDEGTPRDKLGKAAPGILPGEAIEQAKQGDAAKLRAMVEDAPGLTEGRDDQGETLLYHAASSGNAEKVDFLLSKQGQEIIVQEGTLPVRPDVAVPAKFGLPAPEDAVKRAIKVDYLKMIAEKEATIKKFTDIMQGK